MAPRIRPHHAASTRATAGRASSAIGSSETIAAGTAAAASIGRKPRNSGGGISRPADQSSSNGGGAATWLRHSEATDLGDVGVDLPAKRGLFGLDDDALARGHAQAHLRLLGLQRGGGVVSNQGRASSMSERLSASQPGEHLQPVEPIGPDRRASEGRARGGPAAPGRKPRNTQRAQPCLRRAISQISSQPMPMTRISSRPRMALVTELCGARAASMRSKRRRDDGQDQPDIAQLLEALDALGHRHVEQGCGLWLGEPGLGIAREYEDRGQRPAGPPAAG